jgi:hypothetical protein
LGGGDGLGPTGDGVGFVVQDLPLQIAKFDDIPVDQDEFSDSGSCQRVRQVAA